MYNHVLKLLLYAVLAVFAATSPLAAQSPRAAEADTEISFLEVDSSITVRRMVVHSAHPKGTVLLLHGFPETLYSWRAVATALADEYEVHAFDWPGYGQSSRPAAGKFAFSPQDYANVLRAYVKKARIDRSRLVIYATDIGGLPAMLAALNDPRIARTIIVGDFAPFDRPQFMQARLQALKTPATGDAVRIQFNAARDEILANAMRRGLPVERQFEISPELKNDMADGWTRGEITTADAFYRYYSNFTPDQVWFEANLARLKTPVRVVWGEKDVYINSAMGAEFAKRAKASFTVLPGIGHYPHLQDPIQVVAEIRASLQ
ncbi:MAG: alpha/beta hydrolase [Sphingomonas sp.]|nr:alpha/beta hydrolase [Sphingomonas sp.]